MPDVISARLSRPQASSPSESDHESRMGDGEHMVDATQQARQTNGIHATHGADAARHNLVYQPGSIVRVLLDNFVTYERAEFFPGPKLNMVIGPNGTGKSSLVCAICLGLGYPPNVLGRATTFSEFVRHGRDQAYVEVELQKRPRDARNFVIKLGIHSDNNNRRFWLNGKDASHKEIRNLTETLRIQIDNLCQFLPQDKVAEFAGLNPVELLSKTLQAAAPVEMQEQQEKLSGLFKSQREAQQRAEVGINDLQRKEALQQTLQADVDKLREREAVKRHKVNYENAHVFRQYDDARIAYNRAKARAKDGKKLLKELQEKCAPALATVNRKEEYQEIVAAVVKSRSAALKDAENAADAALGKIDNMNSKTDTLTVKVHTELEGIQKAKQQIQKVRATITKLEGEYKQLPQEFDAADWNQKIRDQEHQTRELDTEYGDLDDEIARLRHMGTPKVEERRKLGQQLRELDSQAGAKLQHLAKVHKDASRGWDWLRENMGGFEKEVFGPPMLSCSIRDERYSDLIQSFLSRDDFLCFITQTRADHKKLSQHFLKDMRLSVTIRTQNSPLESYRPYRPVERLSHFGLDGYAIDQVEGPAPVLAMLCENARLHQAAVGLCDVSEDAFHRISEAGLDDVAAGQCSYRTSRRREFGPSAVSTRVLPVSKGVFWTDQAVDSEDKSGIEWKIQELGHEIEEIKTVIDEKRERKKAIDVAKDAIAEKIAELRQCKNVLQKQYTKWQGLPSRIEMEKKSLADLQVNVQQAQQRKIAIEDEVDEVALEKAKMVLRHQQSIFAVRKAHQAWLEAMIYNIEAISEVAAFRAENVEVQHRLDEEKKALDELQANMGHVRKAAEKARDEVQRLDFGGDEEAKNRAEQLSVAHSLEELESELVTIRARLEIIQASNPHALVEYEKRQAEIDQLKRRKKQHDDELEELDTRIHELRGQWEPRLDELIGKINDAFSYNFEQISCAGEVGVHKDDDFDKWAVEIKVKFRPGESLQQLDQHRQSGGERAVSTIFYLMSLQSMAQAPFRVVDEINQGMDPRNERMVHERMVEIACREHTSQYFLITPKLLAGLRYDEGMRVLCIASGPQMPVDGAVKLDTSKFAGLQRKYLAQLRRTVAQG